MIGRLLLLAIAWLPIPASALADEPSTGEAQLQNCKICHSLDAGGANRVGPGLHGVFGRKAGTVPGFAYSDAMKGSGIVWNGETLAKFLHDPRGTVPGNHMAFAGIQDEATMRDLLQRLKQATQ